MSKQRIIVEAVLAGKSQREVAGRYGITQPRVSQLMAAYRAGGWTAVEPRSTRPRSNPNTTPPEVVDRVLQLRRELLDYGADAGPASIHTLLQRQGRAPSPTTIWRILTRAGLITPQPRKRPKRAYLRFAADLPNQCWQADFTHWRLATGRDAEILLWVDDHSRYLLSATAHQPVTGADVVATFRTACQRHGTPQSTLTDNGMVFTTRHRHGPNAFEVELLELGVQQKNGHPNHPQTQGKVERLNQTLKRWLLPRPADDLRQLQALLEEFTTYYNQQRPHRSLDRRTPAQAYTARAKAGPEHNRAGHWRHRTDTVDRHGKVSLRRGGKLHHIGLGAEHKQQPVRMLIHNLDIIIIHAQTGEILRELTLDPTRDYQPLGRHPGPPKDSPQRGGRQRKPKPQT